MDASAGASGYYNAHGPALVTLWERTKNDRGLGLHLGGPDRPESPLTSPERQIARLGHSPGSAVIAICDIKGILLLQFIVKGSAGAGDKFINSNLDQGLKEKGTRTVIVIGTSAQVAVGGIAFGAAQRGYKAVVPVDGMSSEDAYNEQYAAWHIYKGGPQVLRNNATLTRGDLIKFGS